jgi:predicted ABC-type ATPase
MNKPILLVIAGCNGSGKSSFSTILTNGNPIPFDYDKHFLNFYNSITDFDLRERMAHNKTRNLLENSVKEAIKNKASFCYETNFNSTPLHWPSHFKKAGYQLDIIFFCLDSVEEAKKRVSIRVENGGHYVPQTEIEKRFFEGYKNLDDHYTEFDNVHLLNSSPYNQEPEHITTISFGNVIKKSKIPDFLKLYLPKINSLLLIK